MTSSETPKDPFKELISFLIEATGLDEKDAKIYALGLKKGIITSGDVVNERLISRQTTAADRLRRLANDGYLECSLGQEKKRGKGYAKKYRANPPELLLKDLLEKYRGIHDCLEKIREHRELLSETTGLENEIWLIKPQKIVIRRTAEMIRNGRQSIKIYSHDCTWFHDTGIKNALGKAVSNEASVEVLATKAEERVSKGLKKLGISFAETKVECIPFCLIDESLLLFPCTGGALSREYFVIATRQRYLVDNFLKMFNNLQNWSK